MSKEIAPYIQPIFVLDSCLCDFRPWGELYGIRRFIIEFLYFGMKEAWACMFAGLFFLPISLVLKAGLLGLPCYDLLR